MPFCPKCGREVEETVNFCPSCGARITVDGITEVIETSSEKKVLAAFGYLSIFVWIYLLIFRRDDEFLAFQANQQTVALIFEVGLCLIPFLGWAMLLPVAVFEIIALVGACYGKYRKMPLIGDIVIFKRKEVSAA